MGTILQHHDHIPGENDLSVIKLLRPILRPSGAWNPGTHGNQLSDNGSWGGEILCTTSESTCRYIKGVTTGLHELTRLLRLQTNNLL